MRIRALVLALGLFCSVHAQSDAETITFTQGGSGGSSGVSSVTNSDGTLTISPTTGPVVASLNLANPNSWTAPQTFALGTITANANAVNITGTWNNAGVTFDAPLSENITNTASNVNSLIADLKVGGASEFTVSEGGVLYSPAGYYTGPSTTNPTAIFSNTDYFFGATPSGSIGLYWAASLATVGTNQLALTYGGVNTLQFGLSDAAAPAAQILKFQSVVAGTSNTAGANALLNASVGTGTGKGGNLCEQTAPASTSSSTQNTLVAQLCALGTGGVEIGGSAGVTVSGELAAIKISASGSAPGAGVAKMEWVTGTNAGSCKLISYAGTSTTPVTIIDNVGTGC